MSGSTRRWPLTRAVAGAGVMFLLAACSDRDAEPLRPETRGPEISSAVSAIGTVNNPTAGNRLDLSAVNNTEEHKGSCFIAAPTGSATGTGLYKPFKRVNVNKTWFQAWNTSTRPHLTGNEAEPNNNWTNDIRLSEIPVVPSGLFPGCDNGPYREVRMDINQANPLLLAINQIRIYVHIGPNGGNVGGAQSLVWSLDNWTEATKSLNADGGDDHTVIAKKLASGSGRDDLILLIPEEFFPPAALAACPYDQGIGNTCNWYFTFFSEAGSSAATSGPAVGQNQHDATVVQSSGFEEWGVILRPIPPKITLVKTIINDHNGTAAVGDFNILTSAGTPIWDCQTAGSTTTCTSQEMAVSAGTVTFSEIDLPGYTEGSWSCVRTAPSASGPHAAGAYDAGSRVVADGESWTCSITNNDDAASLTLKKIIVNDNGGTKVVGDFGIVTSAGALVWNCQTVGDTTTCTSDAFTGLSAGTYTFSEQDVTGYTEGSWSCSPVAANVGKTDYDDGAVTLGNGQSTTCEITNDDQAATITLIKHVDNAHGGTATATDFSILLNGGAAVFGAPVVNGTVSSYSTGAVSVDAGTQTFSESDFAGYTEGTWSCAPVGADVGKTAYDDGAVTLGNGQSTTCEITNTQDPPVVTTQTAYALGSGGGVVSSCFIPTFSQWGWNNGTISAGYDQTWNLWAGAADCDTSKGMLAGTVRVQYTGGQIVLTFNMNGGFTLESYHLYAGSTPYPMKNGVATVAPGQYYVESPLPANVYVIVHAVVGTP